MSAGVLGAEEQVTLKEIQGRLEPWRNRRTRLGPIPEELWEEEARLTEEESLVDVSRSPRLTYTKLKA
jgi:hypothetical protein